MSNGISFKKKITTTASIVAAVAGGVLAPAVLAAPAAHASISFCCAVTSWVPSATDPTQVTATVTNNNEATTVRFTFSNGAAPVDVPLPKTISVDTFPIGGGWIPGVPSSTPVRITVPSGVTVTASWQGEVFGSYTNKAAPAPVVVKPQQVGNVVTIPGNQNGAVEYLPMGGAAKPLPAGYQWTLTSGQTAAIGEFTTDGSHTLLGSWTYAYVAPAPAQLTPQLPTHVSGNLWSVPAVSGYHFEVNGTTIPAGDYYVPAGGVTVVAVSDSAQLQLVGKTSEVLPYATPPKPDQGSTKVMVCHLDGQSGKYSSVTVSVSSLKDDEGHAGHAGDIYPEFTYQAADDFVVTIPAHNWNADTKKIYEANCTVPVPTPPPGDTGDHGGNTGGNTGDTGNHGGNTGNTGGNGGNTTTPGSTTTSGGTTNTTSSSTSNVTVQTPSQPAANNQAVEQNTAQPATTGYQAKVDTAIGTDTASATDPASIAWLVGAAGVIGLILVRRPKHRKEA